jgi:hypothetical protein
MLGSDAMRLSLLWFLDADCILSGTLYSWAFAHTLPRIFFCALCPLVFSSAAISTLCLLVYDGTPYAKRRPLPYIHPMTGEILGIAYKRLPCSNCPATARAPACRAYIVAGRSWLGSK